MSIIDDESLTRQRPALQRWGIAALCFAVAFLARAGLEGDLPPGFPFLTFFPAVIITAVLAGTGPAVAIAIVSGLTAWWFFIPPFGSFGLDFNNAIAMTFYAVIVVTDILIVDAMQRALRALNAERTRSSTLAQAQTLMFHELQHRVSNNLATVAGLLKIQSRTVSDPGAKHALETSVSRINLIGRMQRMLHDPASQQVDFGRFLREVSADLIETSGLSARVTCDVRTDPVMIQSEQSVPLALITTEFIANALEHAFPASRKGRLTIDLALDGEDATLRVQDDGPGLAPGFDPDASSSLGLAIARQLATQLQGSLTMDTAPCGGARSVLRFRVIPDTGLAAV